MQNYKNNALCATDTDDDNDPFGSQCDAFWNGDSSADMPSSIFDLLYWNEEMCCQGDPDHICCPNNYGWDSTIAPGGNDPSRDPAGGGCYVKTICFNIKCVKYNLDRMVLKEWRRREKIASALCNGVMTYFWENDWVNGFLYQFQFKAKTKFSVAGYDDPIYPLLQNQDSFAPDSQYCKKTTYFTIGPHQQR